MTMSDTLGEVSDVPMVLTRPEEHATSSYTNLSNEKFLDHDVDFRNQYCKIYRARLESVIPLLKPRIEEKWGLEYPIIKLCKLQEDLQRKCIVIGTLFKDQKLKPSLLQKIADANALIPAVVPTHFSDDSDLLYIEDELQRYLLIGNVDVHNLVTGITCALLGSDQGFGKFLVEDWCFPQCRLQVQRPLSASPDETFICFISGIDTASYPCHVLHLKLFLDWVIGFMGNSDSQDQVRKIARVVIAGNSVRSEPERKKHRSLVAPIVQSDATFNAVRTLDGVLCQLVRVVNVDLMPGQFDPSNHLLAQQPMHKCMFPKSSEYATLNCVTNPYEFEVNGFRFLGTSGQPVKDILAYCRLDEPVEAMEQCLEWSHIAPTCPDTLGCYPYFTRDPFVIQECPHVMFAGNQPSFQTKMYTGPEGQKVRLVCVPPFGESFSVVLLNLNNLDCHEMQFEIDD